MRGASILRKYCIYPTTRMLHITVGRMIALRVVPRIPGKPCLVRPGEGGLQVEQVASCSEKLG